MSRARNDLANQLAVYLVADPDQTRRDLYDDVSAALDGGVTAVQLRAKTMTDRASLTLATRLCQLCHDHRALFFVNDRLDLALAAAADGVHLGVDDLPIAAARSISGGRFLIGYSPQTDDEVAEAAAIGADYIGIGPVFATGSKPDAGEAIGLGTLRRRAALTSLPAVGIGGINTSNAAEVIAAGAVGVSVISAILSAADPREAAAHLRALVDRARTAH